jgi:hypothetical protein
MPQAMGAFSEKERTMSRWYSIMRKSRTRSDLEIGIAAVRDVDAATLARIEGGRIKVPFPSSTRPIEIVNLAEWRSAWGSYVE